MTETGPRRDVAARKTGAARAFAAWLSRRSITPNQISVLSSVFAAVAGWCLYSYPAALAASPGGTPSGWAAALPPLAAFFMLMRLLCNLFDGMVAVEGGKSTPSGDLFNDIPDRVSDSFILIGAGYCCKMVPHSISLGWAAALMAVMTAYVRTMAMSAGAPADFRGPMAKEHRMFLMMAACLLTLAEPRFWAIGLTLHWALIIVAAGGALTCARRAIGAYRFLEARGSGKQGAAE